MFGRKYKKDERDKAFLVESINTKRRARMWRDDQIQLDQGDSSMCVGYAWAHWLAAAPIINYMEPSGIYQVAQRFDEWSGENYDGTSVRAGAKVLQLLGFIDKYTWAFNIGDAINTLLELGPVVLGCQWYTGMMEPDRKNYVSVRGNKLGGHAVVVTGIDIPKGFVRIKNSWGKKWGDNGRCYLSLGDFEILIKEKGEVCLAVERDI